MTTPQEHYESLLARRYTWMFGVPFPRKVEEQVGLLRRAGVSAPGMAVDLGCGSGFQSMALVELGATLVHAVDTSAELLRELAEHARGRPVAVHAGDLMDFDLLVEEPADTIVCMGDTLTHLRSRDDVEELFRKVALRLRPGGRTVFSWRDLSRTPDGLDRFLPVRADADAAMLCFLEDRGESVMVHDLIYARSGDGWQLHKGCYPKLKLSPAWVAAALERVGLVPRHQETAGGLCVLAASR